MTSVLFCVSSLLVCVFLFNYKKLLIIFLAVILALINFTKLPKSDYLNYLKIYSEAESETFIKYFSETSIKTGMEPFFLGICFASNNLIGLSGETFFAIISFIIYCCMGLALNNIFSSSKKGFIVALSVFFFLPPIFSLSHHLIRQFLAISICFYFLSIKSSKTKNFLYVIPIGVHLVSIIPTIISYIKTRSLFKLRPFYTGVILAAILFLMASFLEEVFSFFAEHQQLFFLSKIIFFRESSLPGLNLYQLSIMAFCIISAFTSIRNKKHNVFNLLAVFIATTIFLFWGNNEITQRLFFILYFIIPIQLAEIFNRFSFGWGGVALIFCLLNFLFFSTLTNSVWDYMII